MNFVNLESFVRFMQLKFEPLHYHTHGQNASAKYFQRIPSKVIRENLDPQNISAIQYTLSLVLPELYYVAIIQLVLGIYFCIYISLSLPSLCTPSPPPPFSYHPRVHNFEDGKPAIVLDPVVIQEIEESCNEHYQRYRRNKGYI